MAYKAFWWRRMVIAAWCSQLSQSKDRCMSASLAMTLKPFSVSPPKVFLP